MLALRAASIAKRAVAPLGKSASFLDFTIWAARFPAAGGSPPFEALGGQPKPALGQLNEAAVELPIGHCLT